VYYDEEFLASMALLAEVCVSLGDLERASEIYDQLRPHAERNAFAMIELSLGSVARPLGILAGALGRMDAAVDHLERAIEINTRMGARPWVAHSTFELGHALARTGGAERAAALLTEALNQYRAFGMAPWERKAERALDELGVRAG
jgi:tetratricopeptide (TPR) repeat protein